MVYRGSRTTLTCQSSPSRSIETDIQWLLFDISSKYDPESLHSKLDSLVYRSLTPASEAVRKSSPSRSLCVLLSIIARRDQDTIVLLRKEAGERQYLLCIGRKEAWQKAGPEDMIMTAVQNGGLATGEFDQQHG